jgi:hypothetical protein
MAVRVQVSPLPPLFLTLLMPKLTNWVVEDNKIEGCKFGRMDKRMAKRKRQRQAAKAATPKLYKQNNNGFKNA